MGNTISIVGQALEIPAGVSSGLTGSELTRLASKPRGSIVYEITPEGHHIVPPMRWLQPVKMPGSSPWAGWWPEAPQNVKRAASIH